MFNSKNLLQKSILSFCIFFVVVMTPATMFAAGEDFGLYTSDSGASGIGVPLFVYKINI
jgi:hypothetical protein